MSVLVNKDSIEYGTNVVGGVTPGKGGQTHLDRPVFNTVLEAVEKAEADTTIIFVPPAFAADAIMEAADAGIKVIITITEGIPVADMIKASNYIKNKSCRLIGPNCPGIITPGEAKVGIMPGFVFKTVVMIGEIGGQLEADAANWYKASGSKKPVVGFIAGETAPAGRTMGHAGAIVGGSDDTAQAKKAIMKACGIHVVDSPAEIGKKVAEVLGK